MLTSLITIDIRTSLALSEVLDDWKFQVMVPEGTRFDQLIKQVDREHDHRLTPYIFEEDSEDLSQHIMFMINGRNIRFLDGEGTVLSDGDLVTILLPAGGG